MPIDESSVATIRSEQPAITALPAKQRPLTTAMRGTRPESFAHSGDKGWPIYSGTTTTPLPQLREYMTLYRERFAAECPVAERAGDEVLSLPLSPAHSDDDIRDAIDALRRVHARFTA